MQTIFNERMDTKKLRQKILDLAIHGKLVPQDPNDEPASVLLERIRAEKERLIAEGKIKRSKRSATSNTSHYENVAEGWVLTDIGELLINRDSERVPLSLGVRSKQENKIYDYYGATGVVDKVDGYLFDERLLLIGEDGANLLSRSKDNAFFAEGKYWVNNHAHILDCPEKEVLDYVAFLINSMSLEDYITGSAQPKLNQDNLNKIEIPLPPLEEQRRIIAQVNLWQNYIQDLEASEIELKESVESAKSKILDLAIHGKLVPQDPNDEPASELLKRINPKFTPCDNAHYENVPSNWALARVEDIGQLLSGRDLTKDECNSENIGLPYLIGASNIEGNTFSFIRWTEKPQVVSQIGDILISCKGTIGAIVKNNIGDIHIARQFMAIRPNTDGITSDYLHICMIAVVEEIKKDARGVIPGIARDDILTKVFAIPPINEQRRIIAAINQYHSILDNISANL